MPDRFTLSRRDAIIGGAALGLFGCNQPGTTTTSSEEATWTNIKLFISLGALALPGAGWLLGSLKIHGLARLFSRLGSVVGTADDIISAYDYYTLFRSQFYSSPGTDEEPRSILTPQTEDINNYENVPIIQGNCQLYLGILDEEGANFGDYDIWVAVKSIFDTPPRALTEALGDGSLPSAKVTPARDGSYNKLLDIGILNPGAYIYYSWRVPVGEEPSNDLVANQPLISPIFASIDQNVDVQSLAGSDVFGPNVEARYQVPPSRYL